MNPYREPFYQQQARWHRYEGPDDVARRHANRARYYRWYTRGWLPEDKSTPILDIGCGSGQFLYFLRELGYTNAVGLDLDTDQARIGRALGLDCRCVQAQDYLQGEDVPDFGLVVMLDIIEHFTREEAFATLDAVSARLAVGGRIMASVPNSESPNGLRVYHADITHEASFTPQSLEQMLFCHGLRKVEVRDPWPAPVSPARVAYRMTVQAARALEGVRMRLLGLEPPTVWSPVFWILAEKEPREAATLATAPGSRAEAAPTASP